MTVPRLLADTAIATAPAAPRRGVRARVSRYSVLIASTDDEVRAAQRLRHRVFVAEMGATLDSATPGLDVDEFDAYCDHLVVREDHTGDTVGTYRILPPHKAPGRLYADAEFDLAQLAPLRDILVETGRSCVHAEHRNGAVINLMWTGIARYLHLHGFRWLAGCASVPLADGGRMANAVWELARTRHLSPPRLRTAPLHPYRMGPAPERGDPLCVVPPLMRGYLRLGAWVCGEPAHDPNFGVADFFMLLSLDRVDPRYLRHFLA